MGPTDFEYFLGQIHGINLDDLYLIAEQSAVVDRELSMRLEHWSSIHSKIDQRNDWHRLYDWIRSVEYNHPDKCDSQQARMMLMLFNKFSQRGVEPFTSRSEYQQGTPHTWDWTKLPSQLRYLIEPAMTLGKLQFPNKIAAYLDQLDESGEKMLDDLIVKVNADWDEINRFLDEYRMTKHPEAQRVYFLTVLLADYNDRRR